MKVFIMSAAFLGFVAMNATGGVKKYTTNDGHHSPSTFSSKSTEAMKDTPDKSAGIISPDYSEPSAVPDMNVAPEVMNTSPNPAPTKSIDNSSYGEAVIQTKRLNEANIQAEEERPTNSKPKSKRKY